MMQGIALTDRVLAECRAYVKGAFCALGFCAVAQNNSAGRHVCFVFSVSCGTLTALLSFCFGVCVCVHSSTASGSRGALRIAAGAHSRHCCCRNALRVSQALLPTLR